MPEHAYTRVYEVSSVVVVGVLSDVAFAFRGSSSSSRRAREGKLVRSVAWAEVRQQQAKAKTKHNDNPIGMMVVAASRAPGVTPLTLPVFA